MVWIFSGFILPNQCMAWQIHSEESRTPSTPLLKGTAKIIAEESRTPSTPCLRGTAKIITGESGTPSTPHFKGIAKFSLKTLVHPVHHNLRS